MNRTFLLLCTLVAGMTMSASSIGVRTDAMNDSVWRYSQWISVADAPVVNDTIRDGSRAGDGASWFVTTVPCHKPLRSAVWMTTGLGVYQLYVNGRLVGDEVLKPGFTHYAKTRRSFTYDITEAAQSRSIQLAAQVTPGWWADKIITPKHHIGMIGRKCAFRAVLHLEWEDGSEQWIGTDTIRWRAGIAGPVTHAAIFDGEEYDARLPMGYATPRLLAKPEVNQEFLGEILPSNGAEVYLREDLALSPREAYVWKGVEEADENHFGRVHIVRRYVDPQPMELHEGETLVLDFGQNCAAVPEFVFSAAEGTRMTCRPGELLNDSLGAHSRGMDGPEGSVYLRNLRVPETCFKLIYTFAKNKQAVTYMPTCTFFGYRYMSVTTTGKMTIHRVASIPVSSLTPSLETGTITTGNGLINRLIQNTLWGQRSNYLSVPTDCPQRNERLGWTADTQVFAKTGAFFANTNRFFHKWLRDLRDTQSRTGGYPGVAPWGQYGADPDNCMRAGWADAGVIVPWAIWSQFGDTALLSEHWVSMEKYMDHMAKNQYDHTKLSADNGNYQWADWLSYESLESRSGQYRNATGLRDDAVEYWSYLCGSYWVMDSEMMLDMARALGRDTAKYEAMIQDARRYMQERFLLPDGMFRLDILNTMQTPALFALRNRLVEGEAKEHMCARLRRNFKEHGQCLQTGFLGTSILMQTLTDNGMVDIAYDLLFQRRNPSWLYSVDQGATTIWERWNSYTLEQGIGPDRMNSFNHYAYGCVCQWIWETAAGIKADPSCPGFQHIIMKPVPDKRLGSLDATYQSVSGPIHSEWHYEGDTWVWTFSIPQGATATVTLPGDATCAEYTTGTYTVSVHDIGMDMYGSTESASGPLTN